MSILSKSRKQKYKLPKCTHVKQGTHSMPKRNRNEECTVCGCDPCDCHWGNYWLFVDRYGFSVGDLVIFLQNQIKQISDNVWRIRFRPTFTYKIHELFQPYIQTEPFFTVNGFIRNRLNIGIGLVHKKMWFKPGYQLQTDLKNGIVSQIHTLWINIGIKLWNR